MKYSIDNVIHNVSKKEGINAIYMPYDGLYEHCLYSDNLSLYSLSPTVYDWRLNKFPPNYNKIDEKASKIPNRIDIDLVICNSRDQVNDAAKLANIYHLQVLLIEHDLPNKNSKENIRRYINKRLPENVIHAYTEILVCEQWLLYECNKTSFYLPYGIPDLSSSKEKDIDVLVCGDYQSDSFFLLEDLMSIGPNVVAVGNNFGTTKGYDKIEDLYSYLQRAKICVNMYPHSRSPLYSMFAMSAGCVPAANRTPWTESLIGKDEARGILYTDINELEDKINSLSGEDIKNKASAAKSYIDLNHNQKTNTMITSAVVSGISNRIYKR